MKKIKLYLAGRKFLETRLPPPELSRSSKLPRPEVFLPNDFLRGSLAGVYGFLKTDPAEIPSVSPAGRPSSAGLILWRKTFHR
jgi:hypothetical protein